MFTPRETMKDIRAKKYHNMLHKIQNLPSLTSRAKVLFLHTYAYVYIHMCMDLINTNKNYILYKHVYTYTLQISK